jgi:hypothetical protein
MVIGKSKIIAISVYIISFLFFFSGFLFNPWRVLVKNKALPPQGETLVIGRLVKSHTDGIFSGGGLCGRCGEKTEINEINDYQYLAYKENLPCKSFVPYLSQIGFHATVYSMIDQVSPFSSDKNLWILRSFKTATLALVMSLIVLWFFLDFGLLSAIFVFLGVLFTPWFTYLGKDLWFCVWTNFLSFVISLFVLRREHNLHQPSELLILIFASLGILINFIFNGYEWVSTTLIMAAIPFFYYWRKDDWPLKKLVRRIAWLAFGSLVSLAATFSVLIFQISQVKGSISAGVDWIIFSFLKRSYGSPESIPEVYAKQIDHSLSEVFIRYFNATAFKIPAFVTDAVHWFPHKISFLLVILIFLVCSFLILYKGNLLKFAPGQKKLLANLSITTWISILAPFSWYLIFKGHAYSHAHINYITWFMPFCLFGLAMVGATISHWVGRTGKSHP